MISHRRVRRLLPIALALLIILLAQFILVGSVGAQGPEVDLVVEKYALLDGYFDGVRVSSGPYVVAGEELFYEVWVYNSGPYAATDVIVMDLLPPELIFLEDTDNCTEVEPGLLGCELGDLDPYESRDFLIKTLVRYDAVRSEPYGTKVIGNELMVTNDITETDESDNYDVEMTFVQDLADLRITKIGKPDETVQAGEQFTYTIIVDNLGPSTSRNIVVTDTAITEGVIQANGCSLSVRTEGGSIEEFDCNFAASIGVFDLATMGVNWLNPRGAYGGDEDGDIGRMIITINATANEPTDVNNMVTVAADTPDPDMSNNVAYDALSVTAVADLELTKDAYDEWLEPPGGLGDLATAGLGIVYELFVTNNGPSTAENVVIEDNLPAEVDIISVSSSMGSCIAGTPGDPSDPTTCNVGTLAPGATAVMWIETVLRADEGGGWSFPENGPEGECPVIHNDAWTYSDTFDPNIGNNLASTATEACAFSFLYMEKWGEPDPVIAGEVVNYHIDMWNEGPSVASNVRVFDRFDSGAEYLTLVDSNVEGGPGVCSYDPVLEMVICDLGDVEPTVPFGPPHRIITLQFLVDPAATLGMSLTNGVEIWADSPIWWEGGYTETIWIETLADIEVGKTVSDPTPVAGQQVTYHVDVYNNGPSVARSVEITDTLPVSVTYVVDTLGCGPGLECDLGDLGPGESRSFDIVAQVDPNAMCGDALVNEALVSTLTYDPNELNDIGRAGIAVECEADLKIRKFGKPDGDVWAGQELVYTIVVNNLGPGTARNVVINDRLTSNGSFDLLSVTSDRPGAVISPTTGTFDGSMLLRAELPELEVMTPEQSGEWALTVVVVANEAQSINNLAWVLSDAHDPDPSNNEAFAEHDIHEVSDLGLTKTAWGEVQVDGEPGGTVSLAADEVTAGRNMTYTVNVMNGGPSTAYNVMVQDQLPPLIEMTGVSLSQGSYYLTMGGQQLNGALGNIASGGTVTITVNGFVPSNVVSGTVLINGAQVHSDVIDHNNANDFATHETTVNTWADLSISKVQEKPALPGQMINYTIVVSNVGPSDAYKAMLWDDFPAEIVGAEWTAMCEGGALFRDQCENPAGGCTASGAGDIEELVDLPVGARITVDVGATLFGGCEVVTNTVSIIAPIDAPKPLHPMEIRDPYVENSGYDAINEVECQYWPLVIKDIFPE